MAHSASIKGKADLRRTGARVCSVALASVVAGCEGRNQGILSLTLAVLSIGGALALAMLIWSLIQPKQGDIEGNGYGDGDTSESSMYTSAGEDVF